MDEELKAGIRGLSRLMRQDEAKAVLSSIGWHANMPLVVALRHENMGAVIDRASGADSLIILIFHADAKTYTVTGWARGDESPDVHPSLAGLDVEASRRNIPVAALEDNALGKPDPFKSYRPTMRPQVLQLA